MNFTPPVALYYLARNRCARPLSGERSHELANAMRSGTFDAKKAFIDIDEEDCLVGGQNVLSAIVDSGIPQDIAVREGMSYFPALILYTDKNEYVVVTNPAKIESGREFTVVRTNIEIK